MTHSQQDALEFLTLTPATQAKLIRDRAELLEALEKINQQIYAKGAPLGTEDYFSIRGMCCAAIARAKGE